MLSLPVSASGQIREQRAQDRVTYVASMAIDVGEWVILQTGEANFAQLGIHLAVQQDVAQSHIPM